MTPSEPTTDCFRLQRFVTAQRDIYDAVRSELKGGRKQTHWMWFTFPQVDGLGYSSTARHFAIRSRDEAVAYLATPLLGARMIECTRLLLALPDKSAHDIFGSPDDMKFRSSMTLFDAVDGGNLYRQALARFFDGKPDPATLAILREWREDA
jgi:uncharacterized protein (DUF1810 family)